MPLRRKPFSEWNSADLDYLIADPPASESATLDFKKACMLLSTDKKAKDKAVKDILKDVASFANGRGGALLFGVAETRKGGSRYAAEVVGIERAADLEKKIDDLVCGHLDVRPEPLSFHRVPTASGKEVLIVEIEQSIHSLAMITLDGVNQFWERRGTNNRPMSTDEIQSKFGQLSRLRESGIHAALSLRERVQNLFQDKGPTVWCAGVPLVRIRDGIPARMAVVETLWKDPTYFELFPDRARQNPFAPYELKALLGPGASGLTLRPRHRDGYWLDINRDGSILFAIQPYVNGHPEGTTPEHWVSTGAVYEAILSTLHLIHDAQERLQLSSSSVLCAGVVNAGGLGFLENKTFRSFPQLQDGTELELSNITVGIGWDPTQVFDEWVLEFANALGRENPVLCPPWVQADPAG